MVLVFAISRQLHHHTYMCVGWRLIKRNFPENFKSRRNINTLFPGLEDSDEGISWIIFFYSSFPFDNLTNYWYCRSRQTTFVSQNSPTTIPYTNWICMREPTCSEGHHLVAIFGRHTNTPRSLPILPLVL